ncbi:MAG: hypothetical protein QM805_07655 [Pseudomonas sp.]
MARNQAAVTVLPGVWTELTNSDTATITFQVVTGAVKVRATTGSAPSALSDAGLHYLSRPANRQTTQGELRVPIASLAALAGAVRLFATPLNGRKALVIVDHG